MRIHSLAVAVAGLVAVFGAEALACRCMPPDPSREGAQARLDASAAVFQGKVVSVAPFTEESGERGLRITFDVSRSWKGVTSTRVDVATAADTAACGIEAEVGRDYLVFAQPLDDGDARPVAYSVQSCNGTGALSQIQSDRPEWLALLAETPALTLTPATQEAGQGADSTPAEAGSGAAQAHVDREAPKRAGGWASCSSTGLGLGALPLLAVARMLRRRRASPARPE